MEISLAKSSQTTGRVNPLMFVKQSFLSALIWVNLFFTMTKIDRYKAGINTSGEGRADSSIF